ncbi:MAG: peptidoglycan DD-metalloendopeptidase family protein, partial [Vibrio sp.]
QILARLIKFALAGGAAVIALQVFLPSQQAQQPIQLKISEMLHLKSTDDQAVEDTSDANLLTKHGKNLGSGQSGTGQLPSFEYTVTENDVQKGDVIGKLFKELELPKTELANVLESDNNNLAFDNIEAGDVVRLWVHKDKDIKVNKLEVQFNLADRALFTRNNDNSFEYNDVHLPGVWRDTPISGEIHGSFSVSAQKMGIPYTQADQIVRLLKTKINFSRDLRAGDRFEVIQRKQYIDDKATGNSEIQAVRIYTRDQEIAIYQHTDGQFYDENGNSLNRAFNRYPSDHELRVTSKFNPYRRHPVTGRVSPHNGVDFHARTGDPVLATGDGVVTLVANHPYAGKYVVIQNSGKYKTRFMHMSKIMVKQGQSVQRGQQIGKAGATGRVTGPHIHYEFIVNNKPVNPMTADIPMASEVPASEKAAFKARIAKIDNLFSEQKQMIAQAKVEKSDSNEDS